MTVGELAKKRGQPVGEFVKTLQDLGFSAGSHAKKLTQGELDEIHRKLDGSVPSTERAPVAEVSNRIVENPNVLMIKRADGKTLVAFVDASEEEDGSLSLRVVESSVQNGIGETLLEYRKQVGMKMGVN
jgi:hypothetical protein